jgi:hypothetical protein
MDPRTALARFIRWVMRDVTYHRVYPCTVQSQAPDGTLDLTPDDDTIRGEGLSGVPIRHGVPGLRVNVRQGARVLLAFEAGDPSRRYAALWSEDPTVVESVSFGGGTAPVARLGDTVDVFFPPQIPVTGLLSGQPFTGLLTITTSGVGIINSGRRELQA